MNRDRPVYECLRAALRAFRDVPLEVEDFEKAALMANECAAEGIIGSHIDFLICSTARRKWRIFTAGKDFSRYAGIVPVSLYKP